MFGSNYKKNMAKIMGDVRKLETREPVFTSALQFSLQYKAVASE